MSSIRPTAAAIAAVSVFALTGCALGVYVEGSSGSGTCAGKGDVSIATSQNESGDSLTIDYYGPVDVTLGVVQGFYSENNFYDITPTKLTGWGTGIGLGSGEPSVNVSVIVDETGWTTTPTVAGIHASYEGTVAEFLSTLDFLAGTGLTADGETPANLALPFAVGVSCDGDLTSGEYVETLGIAPTSGFGDFAVASEFEFAAAQPVFPNHVTTGALRILSQAPITDGISGTLQLPSGVVSQMGDIALNLGVEFPISIQMVSDPAEIPNNNMSDLWLQLIAGSEGGSDTYQVDLEAPYSLTNTMDFTIIDEGSGGIAEGDYLVFIGVNGVDSEDEAALKLLFGSATYSEADGLELASIDVPLSGDVDETAALSETGVGTDALVLTGFGAALVVVGVTAFAARRRRS